jgi:3-oxoacyl-[acyl-carrier protein] reductase
MAPASETKTVLITGALSDIGRATAQAFARAGYRVALHYRRRPEEAHALAAALTPGGSAAPAIACRADVRSRVEVEALFEQVYHAGGRLDALVNCAGLNRDRPFVEMSDDDWEIVVSTILGGAFMCSQEFARRYAGADGNIVNIGAVTALKGRKNGANYCSARAGVVALTKCLAQELAPRIRVNTVTPGRIDTDELRTRYHLADAQTRARLEQEVPLGRLGHPDDVAAMIIFIVTSGKYLTGQNFFVDGGLYMR